MPRRNRKSPDSLVYEAPDWRGYRMNWYDPHRQIDPPERGAAVIGEALATLVRAGILRTRTTMPRDCWRIAPLCARAA